MNTAAYTPLESLLLFQALLKHGVGGSAFSRISDSLKNNVVINTDASYDAARLAPDALRDLFVNLVREEFRSETAGADGIETEPQPNSKKRKVPSPPGPTLQEVLNNFDRIAVLVEKLYARYRDHAIEEIRADDRRLLALQKDIELLEQAEREEQEAQAEKLPPTSRDGVVAADAAVPARPAETSPNLPIQTPVPVPIPGKVAHDVLRNSTSGTAPVTPVAASAAPPSSQKASRIQAPQAPPLVKAQQTPNPSGNVLQPPIGAVGQQTPRAIQSASPVPLPVISPQPDATSKSRTPGLASSSQPPANTGNLKWEKPYQPPVQVPLQSKSAAEQGNAAAAAVAAAGQPQRAPHRQAQQTSQHPQITQGQASPSLGQPVLAAPQSPAQLGPPTQAGSGVLERPGVQAYSARSASGTPVQLQPPAPPPRATALQQPYLDAAGHATPSHGRPLAPAGSATPTGAGQASASASKWTTHPPQAAQFAQQQFSPSPLSPQPIVAPGASRRSVGSPYTHQPPRPALPAHLVQASASPSPTEIYSSAHMVPRTPSATSPSFVVTGSGTKWTTKSTSSTPRPPRQSMDFPSPAYEPLSPVRQAAAVASSAKRAGSKADLAKKSAESPQDVKPARRGRPPRNLQKDVASSATPTRAAGLRRSRSKASQADEISMDDSELASRIKDEEATPLPHDETEDTTADESVTSRRRLATPSNISGRTTHKRKREESPPERPLPASTPTHVLWTRQFGRISSSALDQISSHRYANQFANPIRERDAPGYQGLIIQSQDIKSIRAAMLHGNRAASEAAKALQDGDPGTPTVWLPLSPDLLPPKSIINSEQLERELVHMFSNAIMYNPDPYRGLGNSFIKPEASQEGDGEAEPSTYRVDEDAVVRDSRVMFVEVERLLSDLRNAERDRSGLPPSATGSGRPTSVAATPVGETGTPLAATGQKAEDDGAEDGDGDGHSTLKRRRVATRA